MKNKPYFPMFVDLSDKKIVVVGGGNIATRRVKTLLSFTRNITVVAPQMTAELLELGKTGKIEALLRPVKRQDFEFAYMVIAATNDWKVNEQVYRVCKEEGVYVNVADDKEKCRPVKRQDFEFAYMVIAATNDWKVNEQVYRVCKEEGVYVNVADDKEKCDFYFPGVYMENELVVGITASGMDHKKARRVRLAIEAAMTDTLGDKDNEK